MPPQNNDEDKRILDMLHTEIHAIRLLPKYKPTLFEQKVNNIVAERFKNVCKDCEERAMRAKYVQPQQENKSFLGGLFGGG